MRVLVVSDVHSNLEALNATVADAGLFDMIWSLGDIVGYGPEPNQCIARLGEFEHRAIAGNHDWGVLGRLDLGDFNADARLANLWTRDQLTPESRAYLEALPETLVQGDFTLAHGSPRHPIWEYIFYASVAKLNFAHFRTETCLVGHTHIPVAFRGSDDGSKGEVVPLLDRETLRLDTARLIVNPGGIGQPRDGDPRAAYAVLDTEANTLEHRRVGYDVSITQRKMRAAGLPPRSIARLDFGW